MTSQQADPVAASMPFRDIRAVLFDVDGTLADSNYLHVQAWHRAFLTVGVDVESWRIHQAIGRDSGALISAVAGDHEEAWVDHVQEAHGAIYEELALDLRLLPGARELVLRLADDGLAVVLATSTPRRRLDPVLGRLNADDAITAIISADDVDDAKPSPDILDAALARVKTAPEHAIMVGDAVWDMEAAGRADVRAIAVLSGGTDAGALRKAGAAAVFDNPDDILAHIHGVLSPSGG